MSTTGGILALDLGTACGWAAAFPGHDPAHGSMRMPSGLGYGAFFDRFGLWLADQITVHAPALLVYEAPVLTSKTHIQTAFRLMGLAAVTEMIGHRREIPNVVPANNQTIKKFVTGSGSAQKIDMIEAMRGRGWQPRDEHAADALGCFLWAEHKFSKVRRPAGPLFVGAAA